VFNLFCYFFIGLFVFFLFVLPFTVNKVVFDGDGKLFAYRPSKKLKVIACITMLPLRRACKMPLYFLVDVLMDFLDLLMN